MGVRQGRVYGYKSYHLNDDQIMFWVMTCRIVPSPAQVPLGAPSDAAPQIETGDLGCMQARRSRLRARPSMLLDAHGFDWTRKDRQAMKDDKRP